MKNTAITSIGCAFATAAFLVSNTQAGEPVMIPEAPSIDCPWSIGLEALYLKAHSNEGNYDDQDYEFAYRLEASYKNADNLGVRLRYFDFEGTGGSTSSGSSQHYPEIEAFDLEIFDTFELGGWDAELSAGIRFASFWEGTNDHSDVDFDGWGPTAAFEVTHTIVGDLSVYAGVRGSWVFGDDDENYDDSSTFIAEGTLGLQYEFQLFGSCPTYVRLGMDAQNWSAISDDDNEDTSLFGGSLKVGFNF